MSKKEELLSCSFCQKPKDQVKKLIAGPEDVYICNECVDLCHNILVQDEEPSAFSDDGDLPSPKVIKEFLDLYVVGQDQAKMTMAVAVYNHYKRLKSPVIDDVEIDKSNLLIIGPSGVGKTHIAKTIARFLDVPFYIADATTLSETGYVGQDVESIIAGLVQSAGYNIQKAERGIVFIDEIDKKSRKTGSATVNKDVSGEGVQYGLLKIVEGTTVMVPPNGGKKHPQQEMIEVDTTNILFIAGGAFVGLDKIVQKRIDLDYSSMGFGASIKSKKKSDNNIGDLLEQVEPEDLIHFGLIPELIGRFPVITHLNELTEEQLIKVLVEPKNSVVKQFKSMFKIEEVELDITQDALEEIARASITRKTGARGLRSIIEHRLLPIQYELPELKKTGVKRVTVNADTIKNNKRILTNK